MNKITRLSIAKIKKHKKESLLLCVLVFICSVLLSASVSSLVGISKITPSMVKNTGCYENAVLVSQRSYSNDFLGFLDDERVERFDHIRTAFASVVKIGEKESSLSFVSVEGEKKYERFDPEPTEYEHPIWLDRASSKSLHVSEGDELTITSDKKDFTYTVAGFYDQGIWPLGSKAVVTEDDLLYLEGYLDRNEVIGIDLKDGTDSKTFFAEFEKYCKGLSVEDISTDLTVHSYEETLSNNNFNMSLLSALVAIMASLPIIAIIVMIRFRIVGDIRDQIVSIGVLEALGYKTKEIAKSYVREYLIISLTGVLLGIIPGIPLSYFLMNNAASTINYGGKVTLQVVPFVLSLLGLLIFITLIARSKAMTVRKYPPVLAFRKGIETHHFKKSSFPLEKTKGNVHVRLAFKGFADNGKQSLGLGFCIMIASITVVSSYLVCSFFGNSDRLMRTVCGHELTDIRIETVGAIDDEDFKKELEAMPEVEKVNLVAVDEGMRFVNSDVKVQLEVYDDYSTTTGMVLTEGRLPEHDNEMAITTQVMKRTNAGIGDTVTMEYGKITRDYVVTGYVNSVVNAGTVYLTTGGFKTINPSYTPDAFDIYLKDGVDKDSFTDVLTDRYGKNITDISNSEITGDTYEDRIRSAAEKKMAESMIEHGVSYMEYAIEVDGQMISGSTSLMKINSITYIGDEIAEMTSTAGLIFALISVLLMTVAAVVVMIILSILMESSIRKKYRELGIMKSMGYTSKELMFQLAFRIIPTALIAVVIGSFVSVLLLKLIEGYVAKITISVIGIVLVDIVILFYCFICAYINARKIKKISVYELMTE